MPFHLFPAPGDKNRGYYLDYLLFRAFVGGFCVFFFNFTERNLHITQMSIVPVYCLSHLTTSQLANHLVNHNRFYDFSAPHTIGGELVKWEKLQSS